MALSLTQLQAARDALLTARATGTLSYRDQNGEEVVYKSDRQMASALAALDAEIAGLGRPRRPVFRFVTSKGL